MFVVNDNYELIINIKQIISIRDNSLLTNNKTITIIIANECEITKSLYVSSK